MSIYTLTNDFHNTTATVRPVRIKDGRYSGLHKISRRTAIRLRSELCGVGDCVCSGSFGERGGVQFYVRGQDYEQNYIVDCKIGYTEPTE